MPGLRLLLLGSPRLEHEETPLKLSRRKAVALLAYLAVTGEAHQRETLAALFWPDHDQRRAHANLRRDLSVLNKTLGDGWLEVDRESVRLLGRDGFWLDVEHFRRLLAARGTHGHAQDEVCSDCIPLLTEAVDLYRGGFMAGFTLSDSPNFDEWQFFEAEELRCELAGALSRLVRALSTQGEFEAAIPYARRWLALEPWHEPAHRELMRLYAWSGQQAAALRQYQECVRVLDLELGQTPEEITTELYQAIRAKQPPARPSGAEEKRGRGEKGQRSPSAELRTGRGAGGKDSTVLDEFPSAPLPRSPSAPQPPGSPAPPHNLPPQPTAFIGREQELRGIRQLLLDELDCRLLTLVGPGGIGKTRLAIEAGMEALAAFPDGVYLVTLAPVSSPEFLVPSIADALALSFEGADPKAQLLSYLHQKEMLLVLDNFEHLVSPPFIPPSGGEDRGGKIGGAVGLLSDILTNAPGIKLLVTSRERLNLQWEWVREIEGLTYPSAEEMGPPTEEAPGGIGTGRVSLEGYSAVRLFVENARRTRPDFSISEADNPAVARICQLLEGMPLGLELASAWVRMMPPQEIAQEIGRNLDFLATPTRDRPERHRSLRALFEHSWQLLSEAERSAARGLSVFRGSFGREAAQQVTGASLPLLVALVDKSMLRGHPSGRYDMHELLRQYAAEILQQIPEESQAVHDRHCRYYAAFLQAQEPHLRGARRSEALAEIGTDVDNVRAAWRRAVAQGRATQIGQCFESLHLFYFAQGWFREGEETFREAASSLKSVAKSTVEDKLVLGQVLARQGLFSTRLGLHREARACLQKSVEVLQQLEAKGHPDARRKAAFSLYHLGEIAWRDGDYPTACQLCQESLAIYRESGDRLGMAGALRRLGMIAGYQGEYAEAKQLFEEALERYQEIGDQYGIANSLNDLGIVADGLGNYAEAKRLYQDSLAMRRQIGHRGGIANTLNNLGYFAYLHGEYAEAIPFLEESLSIFKEIGDRYHLALCLGNLGATVSAMGGHREAQRYFYEAIRFALEIWSVPLVLDALVGTAALLVASQPDEKERAAEMYAFALAHPANDQFAKDRAEQGLADLASQLSPDVMTAAQERGQTAIFEVIVAEVLADMAFVWEK